LNGPDGKIVVDTFLLPAWPKLKENLDGLGNAPLKTVIDTHWHVVKRKLEALSPGVQAADQSLQLCAQSSA